ncbi:hypothetical protein CKO18_19370 [Rhodoferax fermentans]|uniref:Uncharacterized protein n=2 Tax=Rhodoferax fermentans TaxID=28066 RepID=A0A1T1AV29_RHOFE|nr:hypothetical protein [Rhodoferax fermentans]OOV07917.1 hypothetical protein RF819_15360 [Rhodoferax fermentans]
MVNGWAVYANIFFTIVAFRLLKKSDSTPIATTIAMVALTATIPLFEGPILSEATMETASVVSWGWGAILWVISIGVLAAATGIRSGILPESTLKIVPVLFASLLIAIGAYRMYQWKNANDQEREIYLPKSMAFSVADFYGIPFVWPTGPVVDAGDSVAVEIDGSLRSDVTPYVSIRVPELLSYERFGYDWQKFELADMPTLTVRSTVKPKNIALQVKRTPEGAVIRILNRASNTALYEQHLRLIVAKNNRTHVFPTSDSIEWSGLSRGYYDALKIALNPVVVPSEISPASRNIGKNKTQMKLAEEAAIPCEEKRTYFKSPDSFDNLDGRYVILDRYHNFAALCSKSYVGLIFVWSTPSRSSKLGSDVYLYDRITLRPLAKFSDRDECVYGVSCNEYVQPESISRVRIENDKVSVDTAAGVALVKRKY